ncbi:MAG: efflux RND transporter periplasmic adaptor subunit, partial [Opitutaceae bacterium]|nr:efflux RND transporter periplasmic adaptor subunit [Verrucomicrobiales bacterium]
SALASSAQTQEGTRFEVKIRIKEKEVFRPGMSVTADIETRSKTNVLAVPIQSVTTRLPKKSGETNAVSVAVQKTNTGSVAGSTNTSKADRKAIEAANKPVEVVFVVENDMAKMVPVKRGISDDEYVEIIEGLTEGREVVSGGYKAISRDLEDSKKVKQGVATLASSPEKK